MEHKRNIDWTTKRIQRINGRSIMYMACSIWHRSVNGFVLGSVYSSVFSSVLCTGMFLLQIFLRSVCLRHHWYVCSPILPLGIFTSSIDTIQPRCEHVKRVKGRSFRFIGATYEVISLTSNKDYDVCGLTLPRH